MMLLNISLAKLCTLRWWSVSKSTHGLFLSAHRGPYTCADGKRARLNEIEAHAYNLRYLPPAARTFDLCSKAVGKIGNAIGWVPPALQTRDLCLLAITKDPRGALMHMHETVHTEELCLEAVNRCSWALEFAEVKTRAICLAAVSVKGRALQYVPVDMHTDEIMWAAWKNDRRAAEFFSRPLIL